MQLKWKNMQAESSSAGQANIRQLQGVNMQYHPQHQQASLYALNIPRPIIFILTISFIYAEPKYSTSATPTNAAASGLFIPSSGKDLYALFVH
jgi:hypothetical protein